MGNLNNLIINKCHLRKNRKREPFKATTRPVKPLKISYLLDLSLTEKERSSSLKKSLRSTASSNTKRCLSSPNGPGTKKQANMISQQDALRMRKANSSHSRIRTAPFISHLVSTASLAKEN